MFISSIVSRRSVVARLPVGLASVLLFLAVTVGCESLLGEYVVRAPNHGRSLKKVDREKPMALDGTVIDHRLRVEVGGNAPASIGVWAIDPSNERVVSMGGEDAPVFEPTDDGPRTVRRPRGTILIFHGFYDTINQERYLMWGRTLAAEGYRAVLIDQRGHGRSTGDWATYGVNESRDMLAVMDALQEQSLLVEPVGIAAVSLGASTAVQLVEMDDRIDALVLISAFTTMRDVVPDFGRGIGFVHFSDEKYVRIVAHAGRYGGFDTAEPDVISRIGRIDTPTLLIHGEDDYLIPVQHAVRLYHAGDPETTELIRVAGADHTTLGDDVAEPIRGPMLAWFQRYLFDEPVADRRRAARQAQHGN